jgi:ATP-dependent Clp protease ATP-binding subunit ClpB
VNFKNTIIILTSNLGSDAFQVEKYSREMVELKVTDIVRGFFKPEFLNRLDSIVIFNPLNMSMMKSIIKLQLAEVSTRLEKQGYHFKWDDSVEKYLLEHGFDKIYGARPLKRVINEHILDEVALQIVEGKIKPGMQILCDYTGGKVIVKARHVN